MSMNVELSTHSQSVLEEILPGLRNTQKTLPSKYFYDERGSELFEQITHLEEYYPTRIELEILRDQLHEITNQIGELPILIELGSGSSKKTRLLLNKVSDLVGYVPVDISESYLEDVVHKLKREYPNLAIKPVCADYTQPFQVPEFRHSNGNHILFYPGSTIGNFHPDEARRFVGTVSKILDSGGGMLIGVDLKKDKRILEAAYNDRKGITAAFNKNMLVRFNRELHADFNPDSFRHHAFYNEAEGRIEMHLISNKDQTVSVGNEQIHFEKGESIHTENSYKYSLAEFKELVHPWFSVKKVWMDEQNHFSVQYLKKRRFTIQV